MAELSIREKNSIEDLFKMQSGYILDFSNNSFPRFVGESVNIDIYNSRGYEEYASKANKLRQIINNESDYLVGKLLKDLLDYFEDSKLRNNSGLNKWEKEKIIELRNTSERLMKNSTIELPKSKEDNLKTLSEDINISLQRNKPELVLDRLHTYTVMLFRKICIKNKISVVDNNGKYYPLQSLVGKLKNYYKDNKTFETDFPFLAIKYSISLFDKYNEIRNDKIVKNSKRHV